MKIIIGIDPGTTVGVAVLDVQGTVIAVESRKAWSFEDVVEWVRGKGSVLAVGTDKAKVPGFVRDVAAAFSARVLSPKSDLTVAEKRVEWKGNSHECDALASAMFAWKRLKGLISRVLSFSLPYPEKSGQILDLVVKHGMSKKGALEFLEEPEEAERLVTCTSRPPAPREIVRLYNQLASARKDVRVKEAELRNLKKRLESVKGENASLRKQLAVLQSHSARKRREEFQNRRFQELEKKKRGLESSLRASGRLLWELGRLLEKDYVFVPKLESLVSDVEADVYFVARPESFSTRSLKFFRGKCLVSDRKFPRPVQDVAITRTCKLKAQDFGAFFAVERKLLDKVFRDVDVEKLVREHRSRDSS